MTDECNKKWVCEKASIQFLLLGNKKWETNKSLIIHSTNDHYYKTHFYVKGAQKES